MSAKAAASQDEDVDDLDDIVEQFDIKLMGEGQGGTKPSAQTPQASSSQNAQKMTPGKADGSKGNNVDPTADVFQEELAKQLAESMESLVRELSGDANSAANNSEEERRKRQEAFEKMLIGELDASSSSQTLPVDPSQKAQEDEFQASILQAMEKLKASDSTLHTDTTDSSEDPLESLLSQLDPGASEGGDDNEELQNILENMMRQLMSKEILYEPLKELHEKFPAYLNENASTLSEEDKGRYQKQMTCVTKIVEIFDAPSYRDNDQEQGASIVTLMNEMQSYGSPPSEIMGPLPSGLDFSADGQPNLPEGCIIS